MQANVRKDPIGVAKKVTAKLAVKKTCYLGERGGVVVSYVYLQRLRSHPRHVKYSFYSRNKGDLCICHIRLACFKLGTRYHPSDQLSGIP